MSVAASSRWLGPRSVSRAGNGKTVTMFRLLFSVFTAKMNCFILHGHAHVMQQHLLR